MSRPPFFPVHCDYRNHPKFQLLRVIAGSQNYNACVVLWLNIGTTCVAARTPGVITVKQLREVCPRYETRMRCLELLLKTRLIETLDEGKTYSMRNWEAHGNWSQEQLKDAKETRKARNRRYYENKVANKKMPVDLTPSAPPNHTTCVTTCVTEVVIPPITQAVLTSASDYGVEDEIPGFKDRLKETLRRPTSTIERESVLKSMEPLASVLGSLDITKINHPPARTRPSLDWAALLEFAGSQGWVAAPFTEAQQANLREIGPSVAELRTYGIPALRNAKVRVRDPLSYALTAVKNGREDEKPMRTAKKVRRIKTPDEPAFTPESVSAMKTAIADLKKALA